MPIDLLPSAYRTYRDRWSSRNERMDEILDAINGDYDVDDPNDDAIENRSPNFIKVAMEDTAEAASIIPTVRVDPSGPSDTDKANAEYMERHALALMDVSQVETLTIIELMALASYGMSASLVLPDEETGGPVIRYRDPRTCFPEPGWQTLDSVRSGFFARELKLSQLPAEWLVLLQERWPTDFASSYQGRTWRDKSIVLIEYFDEDEFLIAGLYQNGLTSIGGTLTYKPIEFHRRPNTTGICPIVVGQRMTLDNEPRGQFDQLIGMMKAHARLLGMALDYADQAVYSDVWVKDLIGPLNFGGGAFIQLGPNGAIGRVPPAQTDITIFRELDSLIEGMHLSGRYPKSRPGEIDQAIASAKFLESAAGVMNTVIRTYHLIMKRWWEQNLRVAFKQEVAWGRDRMMSGVLKNQQFMIERDVSKIDLKARIRVDYGTALGHDPAQAAVLGIQMQKAGYVSQEYVMENTEGITDVAKERSRIDVEKFRDMALARLLQGLEAGSIPEAALVKMAAARKRGEDIFDIFEEYVIKPAEQQAAQALQTGLGGGPLQPGPLAGPAQGPKAPPPAALLGALGAAAGGGGAPPPGPSPASRLNVPLGGGSFASSNVQ